MKTPIALDPRAVSEIILWPPFPGARREDSARKQFARWDGRPCVARVLAFGSRLSILETYFWMKTTAPVSCAAKSQSWKGETDASVRLLATACGLNLNANRQANS